MARLLPGRCAWGAHPGVDTAAALSVPCPGGAWSVRLASSWPSAVTRLAPRGVPSRNRLDGCSRRRLPPASWLGSGATPACRCARFSSHSRCPGGTRSQSRLDWRYSCRRLLPALKLESGEIPARRCARANSHARRPGGTRLQSCLDQRVWVPPQAAFPVGEGPGEIPFPFTVASSGDRASVCSGRSRHKWRGFSSGPSGRLQPLPHVPSRRVFRLQDV